MCQEVQSHDPRFVERRVLYERGRALSVGRGIDVPAGASLNGKQGAMHYILKGAYHDKVDEEAIEDVPCMEEGWRRNL